MGRQYRKRPQQDEDDEDAEAQHRVRTGRERSHSRSRSASPGREQGRKSDTKSDSKSDARKVSDLAINTILRGRITSVREFGCFVRLDRERERDGLVHISQATGSRIEVDDLKKLFPVGQSVWVKVLSVSPDGKVALSTKLVDQLDGTDLDPDHTGKTTKEAQKPPDGSTRTYVEPIGPVSCSDCSAYTQPAHPSNHPANQSPD